MHSASSGKFVLVTVHAKRGTEGMNAAGVLPGFAGIACHDAWAPYDSFDNAAGHALCGAHVLRELAAVIETGTGKRHGLGTAGDRCPARPQAGGGRRPRRRAGRIDAEVLEKHGDGTATAAAGIALNAAGGGKLQKKRHALATRMKTREADYLRFAHDLRVPFAITALAGHPDEQAPDQDLRLHAVDGRSREILRPPLLPRHRRLLQGVRVASGGLFTVLRSSAAGTENVTVCDRCGASVLPACRGGGVVELGHELAVGGAGGVQVLVALAELEAQVGGLLLEVGDFLVQGVDVGGCAEPGFAPCLLAERFGEPFLELPGAGVEPQRAFMGGEQVRLQGRAGDGGAWRVSGEGRGGCECVDFLQQVAVPVKEGAVDRGGTCDSGDADLGSVGDGTVERGGDALAAAAESACRPLRIPAVFALPAGFAVVMRFPPAGRCGSGWRACRGSPRGACG